MNLGSSRFTGLVFSALVLILVSMLCCSAYAYISDEASSKIAEADAAIRQAFVAVSDADKAGANVSSLAFTLNEAGGLLADANTAFRIGDYGNASSLAEQSISLVNGLVQEAGSFKTMAESEKLSSLIWTTALASIGLSMLFVASLFGWRLIKSRRFKNVLEMKPEGVAEN